MDELHHLAALFGHQRHQQLLSAVAVLPCVLLTQVADPSCRNCQLSPVGGDDKHKEFYAACGVLMLHRTAAQEPAQPLPLLELPDACLLAVMQCFADAEDYFTLFTVGNLHSRLYQAAVEALGNTGSITVVMTGQKQIDSMLEYLEKYGQHMSSVNLQVPADTSGPVGSGPRPRATLRQLPPGLQLRRMHHDGFVLQLLPGNGFQGVLGAAVAAKPPCLKHLQLYNCALLDGAKGLAAALLQLPALEHFSLESLPHVLDSVVHLPFQVLQQLQRLTHLTLAGPAPQDPNLQLLQVLTRLADLRLDFFCIRRGCHNQHACQHAVRHASTQMPIGGQCRI